MKDVRELAAVLVHRGFNVRVEAADGYKGPQTDLVLDRTERRVRVYFVPNALVGHYAVEVDYSAFANRIDCRLPAEVIADCVMALAGSEQ